jgi:UDP-GlcNAc:undecaprenyl-phosphate GlcNAc-1-phosphate transferase
MPVLLDSTMLAIAIGALAALVLSLICIRWVAPLGWTDHPDPRKHHRTPTPRTAGLALWLLLLGVLAFAHIPHFLNRGEWVAVHVMALMGLLDDRLDLPSRPKAIVGLLVALFLAVEMGPELAQFTHELHFLGLALPPHPIVTIPLLTLWFWSIPQAFNLIDGLNGLSMGFSLLVLSVLGLAIGMAPMGGYLAGGMVAVLALNYPKARHFLGDCGSLMLGTLFAVLAVKAFAVTNANLLLWLFAYPTVDVTLVVAVRKWKQVPLGTADRSHLHHYLVDHLGHHRAWLVPLVLLSVALLPMTRALDFPGHLVTSLLGLLGLVFLALKAFQDRVAPGTVVPLRPLKELEDASGPHQVA